MTNTLRTPSGFERVEPETAPEVFFIMDALGRTKYPRQETDFRLPTLKTPLRPYVSTAQPETPKPETVETSS